MENFLIPALAREVAEKDVLAYPMPETVRCQWISHLDVASYAVAAFKRSSTDNLVIDICGPEKLTGPEIAQRFGKALGRRITFRPMPSTEFASAISFGGNEQAVIGYYESVFQNPAIMTTQVDLRRCREALPITPTSMEDFVRIYREYLTRK